MHSLSLVCLAILVLGTWGSYCSSGSSFPKDIKNRADNCGQLLDGGKTSDSSSSSSSSSDDDSDSSSNSQEVPNPTTINAASSTVSAIIQSSTYGQCSCECSGSSGNSGSDESSGSFESSASSEGSGSNEGSGEGSGSNGGSGSGLLPYGDYCLLLQYFYNISIEITEVEIYEAWIVFINECQYSIIYDQSLTVEEKLVAIYSQLEIFLIEYSSISELILNTYIVEWEGYVFDLEATVLFIQYQYIQTIIEIDASGSCILFEALVNATASDAELSAKIEILIQEITVILETTTYTYSYQLVLIYEKIEAFFVQYSSYEEVVYSIEIEGFGSFASFYEVVGFYWGVYSFDVAVGGSVSECALIEVLTEAYENESLASSSQRAQIKELVNTLTTYYESESSVEVRVEYFVEQFYQFIILQEWSVEILFSLEIEGYGSIYELIVAYSFELDCGSFDFGLSTTALPSTTTDVPTTTVATGNCDNKNQLIKFSNNITDLSYSIDQVKGSWNSSVATSFSPYGKRIYVLTSNTTLTASECFTEVVKVLENWSKNQAYLNVVYSVDLQIYHETSNEYTWGTIQQFCDCS